MMRHKNRYTLLALIVFGLVFVVSTGLRVWVESALGTLGMMFTAHPVSGTLVFITLSALGVFLFFFSTVIFLPSALLAWGDEWTLVMLMVGWVMGSMATYGIGRLLGRSVIYRFVDRERLETYAHFLRKDVPFWLVGLLTISVPSELPGYLFGLAKYPWWKFLIAITLAELPFGLLAIYAGDTFLEGRYLWLLGVLVFVFTLAALFSRWVHRRYIFRK